MELPNSAVIDATPVKNMSMKKCVIFHMQQNTNNNNFLCIHFVCMFIHRKNTSVNKRSPVSLNHSEFCPTSLINNTKHFFSDKIAEIQFLFTL